MFAAVSLQIIQSKSTCSTHDRLPGVAVSYCCFPERTRPCRSDHPQSSHCICGEWLVHKLVPHFASSALSIPHWHPACTCSRPSAALQGCPVMSQAQLACLQLWHLSKQADRHTGKTSVEAAQVPLQDGSDKLEARRQNHPASPALHATQLCGGNKGDLPHPGSVSMRAA